MNCLTELINKIIKKKLTYNIKNIEIKRSYLENLKKRELINLKIHYENTIEWIFYGIKFFKNLFYFISTLFGASLIFRDDIKEYIKKIFNFIIKNIEDYDILKIFIKIMSFNIICTVLIIFVIYMRFYNYIQNKKLMIKLIEEKIKLMEEQ